MVILKQLKLARSDEVLIVHDHTVIKQGDHTVMFFVNKKYILDVERLFQA